MNFVQVVAGSANGLGAKQLMEERRLILSGDKVFRHVDLGLQRYVQSRNQLVGSSDGK
jgi:hypothetical protein